MSKKIQLQSEMKHIFREKIILIMFLLPIILPIIFRVIISIIIPYVQTMVSFTITPYLPYILSFTLLLSPYAVGVVMGFIMLDDKDGKIAALLSITPLGRIGYLTNRVLIVTISTFIYSIFTYYVLHVYIINITTLLFLTIPLSLFGATLGLLLFGIATDKVKGLTYAKGLNLLLLFAVVDLFDIKWLSYFSYATPTYWITKIIEQPTNIIFLISGLLINLLWFVIFFVITYKKPTF